MKIATTVKIEKEVYDSFKILGIQNNLTLQTFVDKCVHLYVADSFFRSKVHEFIVPILSCSTSSFSLSTGSINRFN